jgi:hypothetical protein
VLVPGAGAGRFSWRPDDSLARPTAGLDGSRTNTGP